MYPRLERRGLIACFLIKNIDADDLLLVSERFRTERETRIFEKRKNKDKSLSILGQTIEIEE